MKKIKPYVFPILILTGGLLAIYFLLYNHLDFTVNEEKSLAISISAIGLVFGFFQVFLNLNVQAARNKAQLRHSEYKELGKILDSVSALMNESLINEPNIYGLFTSLINKQNEFISFVVNNDKYLFKGIKENKTINDTRILVEALSVRADKYRSELEKLEKKKKASNNHEQFNLDISEMVLQMDWHNDMRNILKEYNTIKYEVLSEIQKYLR